MIGGKLGLSQRIKTKQAVIVFDCKDDTSVEEEGMVIATRSFFFFFFIDRFFFSIRVFFTDTDDSQDSREREGTIYSTLPLPPAHEH